MGNQNQLCGYRFGLEMITDFRDEFLLRSKPTEKILCSSRCLAKFLPFCLM